MGGLVQRRVDQSKMTTNSQFDGTVFNPRWVRVKYHQAFLHIHGRKAGMSFNCRSGKMKQQYFPGTAHHHFNRSKNILFYSSTEEAKCNPKCRDLRASGMSMTDVSYFTLQADFSKTGCICWNHCRRLYTWSWTNRNTALPVPCRVHISDGKMP